MISRVTVADMKPFSVSIPGHYTVCYMFFAVTLQCELSASNTDSNAFVVQYFCRESRNETSKFPFLYNISTSEVKPYLQQ